jgi:glycosyltransferase involved in cell wall biosynthesis
MQGETILCIAPTVWHSLWRNRQQIMSRVAAQNRVLYFEPGRNPDRPVVAEMRRNLPNFFALRTQKVQENLIVIPTPSSLPHARRYLPRSVLRVTMPLVIKINAWILIRHVRWAMKVLDVKAPILWLYGPYETDLIGKFGEKLTCYHNYDEGADFVHNVRIKDLLRRLDNQLSSQVDVIFATSRAQWSRRKAINPNTYFIPNGVDFDLFNRALTSNLSLPADISTVPRPIVGFAGWLGYHIDVKLLRQVAKAYPDCSLVLVGPDALPDTEDRQELRALPNVFSLGQKERPEVPNYLQVFDAALMPYSLSGHIRSAYPLKLHEYLAAGRAIVATAMPELCPYSHVVRIAKTHDEFIHQIGEALHDYSPQAIEARVAVARENTWDQRVAEIYRILWHRLSGAEG